MRIPGISTESMMEKYELSGCDREDPSPPACFRPNGMLSQMAVTVKGARKMMG